MSTPTTSFFSSSDRIAALLAAATAWEGTPYVQSGAVRGNGASCHRLAGAVLADAGFPIPPVPERGITRKSEYLGAMQAWLDGNPTSFTPVWNTSAGPLIPAMLAPGDVLLCKLGMGHAGLYLGDPGAEVLQVIFHTPTHRVSLNDPNVCKRVVAAYRPIEPNPIHHG